MLGLDEDDFAFRVSARQGLRVTGKQFDDQQLCIL